ncbi:MAG: serine hydrolase domain-containing protein [Saprospiraceae bacterium]
MQLTKIMNLSFFLLTYSMGIAQLDPTTQQKLDELFQGYDDQPGVATAIYSKGKIIYQKTAGYANLDYDHKINAQSVFDIGSLSMHFTAACIVLLENDGKLSLDDPIRKHLPELPKYAEGEPTIRHLLHHTSGLRDYLVAIDMTKNTFDVTYDKQQGLDFLMKQKELGMTPGQEYEYSNSNYLLLNHIVSKVSGQSLGEFAEANIFKPLSMENTFFLEEAGKVVKNRAVGYQKEGEDADFTQNHLFNFAAAGDGRLQTTLADFIIWMQNFNRSKIGKADFIKQLLENGVENDGDVMSYALGLEHGPYAGFNSYGHNGYWGSTSCFFLRFPQPDISIVAFSIIGTVSSPGKVFQAAAILLEGIEPKEITESITDKPTVAQTTAQLNQWTGDYIAYKTGYLRKIFMENDTLVYQISPENQYKLIPIGEGEFRMLETPFYSLQFKKTPNGQKNMNFIRTGITQYEYVDYQPSQPSMKNMETLAGRYYTDALDIYYDLSIEDNELVVSVDNQEYTRFTPAMDNLFCSKSGHNGYFTFDKDSKGQPFFMMNDYSMKKVKFEKVE